MKKFKFILPLLLAIILLVHSTSAQAETTYCNAGGIVATQTPWYCSQINQAAAQDWTNWAPVALALVSLSFTIAVLFFVVGMLLRNDRIRNFGVGEMYEAVASILIVSMFLFLSAVMFGLLFGNTVGPIDPFNTSLNYIAHTISSTSSLITNIFEVGTLDYYYASQQITLCEGEEDNMCTAETEVFPPIYKFSVLYGFYWPSWAIFDLSIGGYIALHVEFYSILFFMYAALPVFLIPGIIFRTILPTRHLGGMMMAIAIGFYFIMPLLFSVVYYFTSVGPISSLDAVSQAIHRYGAGSSAIIQAGTPGSPLVTDLANAQHVLGDYWLSVLFYPAIISALTYALVVQIGEILGGLAKTSGRLRGI